MAGCRICKRDMLTARGCAVGTYTFMGRCIQGSKQGMAGILTHTWKRGNVAVTAVQ